MYMFHCHPQEWPSSHSPSNRAMQKLRLRRFGKNFPRGLLVFFFVCLVPCVLCLVSLCLRVLWSTALLWSLSSAAHNLVTAHSVRALLFCVTFCCFLVLFVTFLSLLLFVIFLILIFCYFLLFFFSFLFLLPVVYFFHSYFFHFL